MVETAPRLDDGTPFPTLYYLTCPRAVAALSRLESGGMMREMERTLISEPAVRLAYLSAHSDYLARRDQAARASGLEPLPGGTRAPGVCRTGSNACTPSLRTSLPYREGTRLAARRRQPPGRGGRRARASRHPSREQSG